MPSRRLLLAAFILLHSPCVILPAAPPPELTLLRQHYDKVIAENATAPFEANKAELDGKFIAALEKAALDAQNAGKLDDVIAIQEDKKRLSEKLPIPDDTDTTPEALKKLRAIYREQLQQLEAKRAAALASILPGYQKRLQDLEPILTKAGRIEEAKELRAFREALAQSGLSSLASSAPPAATAPVAGTPGAAVAGAPAMPSTTQPSAATNVKGDDRKAAELILRLGGKIKLTGGNDYISKAEDLPKKKFTLQGINLSTNGQGILEEADAEQLNDLQQLTSVVFNRSVRADAALRFLRTCPNLLRVEVENCEPLTGSWLNDAAPLRKLEFLRVISSAKAEAKGIAAFQSADLLSVVLRDCAVDDAILSTFARFKKLRTLYLRKTKVTDAGMAYLAGLRELVSLNVTDTAVTLEGMKALSKPALLTLGFGKDTEDMAAALPQLGLLFPKVDFFYVPDSLTACTAAQITAIGAAWPKLKKLEFPSDMSFDNNAFDEAGRLFPEVKDLYLWKDKVTDQLLLGISQMKKLERLNLEYTQVSDVGVAMLAKAKSLRYVFLRSATSVTEAGIAAFKKQRPDVKVEP